MTDQTQQDGRRRGGRGWRWILALAALGLLAWFAPAIVAHSPLRQRILPTLAADFPGTIETGAAQLSWFSPVVLSQVKAADAEGQPLLEIQSITSDKTLLALVTGRGRPGLFHLQSPRLHVTLRRDGSNVEDSLAPLLQTQPDESAPIDCAVEIADGVVEVYEAETGRRWQMEQLAVKVDYSSQSGKPLEIKLAGRINNGPAQQGLVQLELQWQMPADVNQGGVGTGQIALSCDSLALDVLPAALRRCGLEVQAGGSLTADCRYTLGSGPEGQVLEIVSLQGRDLRLAAPQWLGDDVLQLARLDAAGRLTLGDDHLTVQDLSIDSNLARLQADGALAWKSLTSGRLDEALAGGDFQLVGEIDLAALARVLPATLQIRQGTELTAGTVSLTASSQFEQGRRHWHGDLEATKLSAIHDGRQITWQQPLLATVSAYQSAEGLVIEELACQASFLQLSGKGTLAEGELVAQGNLDRLAAELGRFVDWGDYRLAGALSASLDWQRDDQQRFDARGNVELKNLELVLPGQRPWREEHLTASLAAEGIAGVNGLRRIDRAELLLESAGDRLRVQLVRPVVAVSADSQWPLEVQLSGDVASWLPRVQPVLPLDGWDIEGSVHVSANGLCCRERLELDRAVVQLRQLRAWSDSLFVDEQEVLVEAVASWDQTEKKLAAKSAIVQCSALALRADDVTIGMNQGAPSIAGRLAFRGDLARLTAWFHDPRSETTRQLFGQLTGQAQFAYDAGVTQTQWSAEINHLVYAAKPTSRPRGPGIVATPAASANGLTNLWQEKELKLSGSGAYRHEQHVVRLDALAAATDWLSVTASGQLSELTGDCRVDLQGQLQYDLKDVAQRLRPYIGDDLQIEGRDARRFTIRGPLLTGVGVEKGTGLIYRNGPQGAAHKLAPSPFPPPLPRRLLVSPQLTATASVAWDAARIQGLAFQQGVIDARLAEGVVRVQPLDVGLSEGRLTAAPRIELNATPMALVVDRGPLVRQVRIAPEMCQTWLKYVAPLLADATRAEGRFSVHLDHAKVPLAEPTAADVSGLLNIHSAQVGPGPLGQQLATIANQLKAIIDRRPLAAAGSTSRWIQIPAQDVAFQMVEGRVQHQRFEMIVGDVTVRTSGSVGLDQSIRLTAELPIQDQWVARDRFLAGMKGKTLKIPIRGTLSQPKIDSRVIEDLSKQIIRSSAGSFLEDELNRGLQRLFGPSQ